MADESLASGATPDGEPWRRAMRPYCSGSSDRTGVRNRRRRSILAANSRAAARSLIASFQRTSSRLQTKAPISVRIRGNGPDCARPNLLDGACRFLSEGRICDRSRDGLRLALARDIALPPRLAVHIDETSEVREAKVIWRRGSTIGIRLQRLAPGRRDDGKPKVCAEGTLLRDSGLSRFTHSSSPRPRLSLASVLMARLIAARVSFSQYTDRASATKRGPKSPSRSHARIASSIVHRRPFTAAS